MNTRGILQELDAQNLLAGSHILTQIKDLSDSLIQKTDGENISYEDYYERLQKQLDALPRLELKLSVAPGTENQYIINLIQTLDQINGDCNRVHNKAVAFLGRLKSAQSEAKKIAASFSAWYILAATDVVTANNLKLLTAPLLKALAESEFSRLMSGLNTEVESLITAVSIQMEQAKEHKKTQNEKFKLGEKQAQQSFVSVVPNFGSAYGSGVNDTIAPSELEEVDEEVPEYVSKKPFAVRGSAESEIRGIFVKRGDPQPAYEFTEASWITDQTPSDAVAEEVVSLLEEEIDEHPHPEEEVFLGNLQIVEPPVEEITFETIPMEDIVTAEEGLIPIEHPEDIDDLLNEDIIESPGAFKKPVGMKTPTRVVEPGVVESVDPVEALKAVESIGDVYELGEGRVGDFQYAEPVVLVSQVSPENLDARKKALEQVADTLQGKYDPLSQAMADEESAMAAVGLAQQVREKVAHTEVAADLSGPLKLTVVEKGSTVSAEALHIPLDIPLRPFMDTDGELTTETAERLSEAAQDVEDAIASLDEPTGAISAEALQDMFAATLDPNPVIGKLKSIDEETGDITITLNDDIVPVDIPMAKAPVTVAPKRKPLIFASDEDVL